MKLLIDENVGKYVVQGLRKRGFHVQSVSELMRGASDEEVAHHARKEKKVIVTMDKDFGRIVLASKVPGVVLLRVPFLKEDLLKVMEEVLEKVKEFYGYITVVERGGRIRRRPI